MKFLMKVLCSSVIFISYMIAIQAAGHILLPEYVASGIAPALDQLVCGLIAFALGIYSYRTVALMPHGEIIIRREIESL